MMKRFILIGCALLLFALVVTILVWFILQDSLRVEVVPESLVSEEPEEREAAEPDMQENATQVREPIPLRDLPLSESQRSMLETAGIDVETFMITPEMITCAEEALGAERFNAIIAGSAPTFLESTQLLRCVP